MSYSVNAPCFNCDKKDTCTDYTKINEVVQRDIHATSYADGHQGSGWITLTCSMQNKK